MGGLALTNQYEHDNKNYDQCSFCYNKFLRYFVLDNAVETKCVHYLDLFSFKKKTGIKNKILLLVYFIYTSTIASSQLVAPQTDHLTNFGGYYKIRNLGVNANQNWISEQTKEEPHLLFRSNRWSDNLYGESAISFQHLSFLSC